jgi:type II secretory pathway component PulM
MVERAAARAIAILVGIALLLALIAFGIHQWQQNRAAHAREKLSTNQAQAGQHTAGVAGNTIVDTATNATESERQSQESQDAINHAQAGNSNDAADLATCELRSYRNSERCRQLRALHP